MKEAGKKSLGDKFVRWGAIAGAAIAIVALAGIIFAAGDKYGASPYIQKCAIPLIQKHEREDSVKWAANDREHCSIRDQNSQQFRVIMAYIKAGLSEEAKRRANDQIVNDTTISPVLKLQ